MDRRTKRYARATTMMATLVATTVNAAPATIESVARETLVEALAPAIAARGAAVAVTIAPDARRAPAPCAQFAGFLPPGSRLVGRTIVGVRCADGTAGWQAFVSADVHVDAPVWQTTRALRAGDPLTSADIVPATAPLTAADVDALGRGGANNPMRGLVSLDGRTPPPVGRVLARPAGAGHALAAGDIREEGRVQAGEAVRVVYQGDGFAVTSEGRTVSPADPGSTVQIRLASGAVVAGLLRADRQVELPR